MGMTDEEANLHDTLSELKRHLRSNETGKIVLIGDVMMDCYIHGYACLLYTSPSPRDRG